MPNEIKVPDTEEEFDAILKENELVVVDFHATWCGPCKLIAPRLGELAEEYENVVVVKVDVDKLEDVASKCDVKAMPTFQLYCKGAKTEEMVGADKGKLEELFQKTKL